MSFPLTLLSQRLWFPPVTDAGPDGLLAVGGDLSAQRLLLAYRSGIFPWYSPDHPLLWWSPDPRLVLYPDEFHRPRRLKRLIRQKKFAITFDRAFERVIGGCAIAKRKQGNGTWIVPEMIDAYVRLHRLGYAHSIEAWCMGKLAGGMYGVSLGGCFFGESMFTRVTNASKIVLAAVVDFLMQRQFAFLDCQVTTDHMLGFGAREIPRHRFIRELKEALQRPDLVGNWSALGADARRD